MGKVREFIKEAVIKSREVVMKNTKYHVWAIGYTVSFNVNGGVSAPAEQAVVKDRLMREPEAPVKAGYVFGGWYKEAELVNRWDFAADTVTENITLYARWKDYREMVFLAGGVVSGAGREGVFPADRMVILSPFFIARYATSYGLWYEVKGWGERNGYSFVNPGREGNDGIGGAAPDEAEGEPVTFIDWWDAVVWCNAYSEKEGKEPVYYMDKGYRKALRSSADGWTGWAVMKPGAGGYRLPTEAEWEYAARGGNQIDSASWYSVYAGGNAVGDVAWYLSNSGHNTHPGGEKRENRAGLYDMSGNVYEWCWDWYSDSINDSINDTIDGPKRVIDPLGPVSGTHRVARGGAWDTERVCCAVMHRSLNYPDFRLGNYIGFRVVRSNEQ